MTELNLARIRSESGAATVLHFEELGSTNDLGLQLVREPTEASSKYPLLILADRQNAGRGQHHRPWISGSGNLTCSLCVPNSAPALSTLIPLVVGLSICEAIETLVGQVQVQLKWPNDLLIGRRKLGGVLIEQVLRPASLKLDKGLDKAAPDLNRVGILVIGMGINVNQKIEWNSEAMLVSSNDPLMQHPPGKVPLPPISLCEAGAGKVDLTELTIVMVSQVLANFRSLASESRCLLDRCDQRMVFRNGELELVLPNGDLLLGRYAGLGDSGELLILCGQQRMALTSIAAVNW